MSTLKTSKAKENILARIRKGLGEGSLPLPYPAADKQKDSLYAKSENSKEELFAETFIGFGGKFVFCDNVEELIRNISVLSADRDWKQLLCADPGLLNILSEKGIAGTADTVPPTAEACITMCEALIARTGSILLSSKQHMGRSASVYYPVHIVVAYIDQVMYDIEDGLALLKEKYGANMPSMINITTGPSRTADIEKTLVVGVHGPEEVFCFLVNAQG